MDWNFPAVLVGEEKTGLAGRRTTTEKCCVALIAGVRRSVTATAKRFVEGDCEISGRHASRPFVALMVAPAGCAARFQVRVCAGTLASVAVLVTCSVCPAVIVALATAAKTGGVLAGNRTPRGTTSRDWLALFHSSTASAVFVSS